MYGMLRKLFYAFSKFQFIEKKAFQKESPWHSMKMIFGKTVFKVRNFKNVCYF